VVGQHRHADGDRDRVVVRARVLGTGRRQHEERVGTVVGGPPGQGDRLAGGGGAGPRQHRDPVADRIAHRPEEPAALVGVERRRLAGRAGDDHAPDAPVHEARRVGRGGRLVEPAARVEQRDERDPDALERRVARVHVRKLPPAPSRTGEGFSDTMSATAP
jgi:hypothetical protein